MKKPTPAKSVADWIQEIPLAKSPAPGNPAPETWEQKQAREKRENREKLFESLCPPLYRKTDVARLPSPAKFAKVLGWNYGRNGLLLVGPTGTGKTRCAWSLIRRLFVEERRQVNYFDGIGWGISVSQAYGQPETTERWLDRICRADVLFLDDLFKAKMTEAQEQALYAVFERRAAWLRPVIATMNSTGEMSLARMTDNGRADRGEPLLRRMREFCEVVNFEPGAQPPP